MIPATKEQLPAILADLRQDVGNCVYMYIDIAKYGLDNPHMKVWTQPGEGKNPFRLIAMRYHDSIQFFSREGDWDEGSAAALVGEEDPSMVSGELSLIQRLHPACGGRHHLAEGYVFEFTAYREFEQIYGIEPGRKEDTPEIARLICSDESIGGYYDIQNLADQLAERMETGMGRSYVIRKDGRIFAHIASYAEFDGIATTAGLIVDPAFRDMPYGAILESYLVHDLLADGFRIFTFVTERKRAKLFTALGNRQSGRYGKMTK